MIRRQKAARIDDRAVRFWRHLDRTPLGAGARPRKIDDDAEKPRTEAGPALEPIERAQHRQPRFLYYFLGDCEILDMREREPQHYSAAPLDQITEDLFIAVPKPL